VPFLGIRFGLPDDRVLPRSASSRRVQNELRDNFTSRESSALSVVLPHLAPASPARDEGIARFAVKLSRMSGVARVDAVTGSYVNGALLAGPGPAAARFVAPRATWLSVVPSIEPQSAAGERLAKEVRAIGGSSGAIVGGRSAELVDAKHGIFTRLPLAGAIIALVTFLLLFSMTGSVLVPVKALFVNLLSLSATFGAMVWIFQEGHLSSVLGFTSTGTLDTSMPILMFCIAFGLSMDYEVFLLSRIKEEHDHGADNTTAVAVGLERTGRIVTAAAALLAVVFIAFATSHVTFLKLLGIGMALAVLVDATLVRGVLVPAFMRLAGNANWWAPAPLRRLYDRFGFHEVDTAHDSPAATPAPQLETSGSRRT
jgi:RND superfamily putative drug exporter